MSTKEKINRLYTEIEETKKLCAHVCRIHQSAIDLLQEQCPHKNLTYYPDPSGNNDSSYTCDECGLECRKASSFYKKKAGL